MPGLITQQHELSWPSRDDFIRLVRTYKECADELAVCVAPPHIDPDPGHLDEDLLSRIMIYAYGYADEPVTEAIEALLAKEETVR